MKPIPNTKFQSQTRCQAPGDSPSPFALKISLFISISDEMPGPWRPGWQGYLRCNGWEFQSQTRCQAPGDYQHPNTGCVLTGISISDEMPGPWRLAVAFNLWMLTTNFNLRRDARPLATPNSIHVINFLLDFKI